MHTASRSNLAAPRAPGVAHAPRPLRLRVHSVLRWLHIYTSMTSLLLVLFFAVTGITLNHPDWLAGESTTEYAGQLPAGWKSTAGVDWLVVTEFLRREHGVRGSVGDHRADDTEGSVTFKAPGYGADCFFSISDGSYQLTVASQGTIGWLNDLHRGRDAGRSWGWLIDASGVFLTLLSITGLGLLWYLKKFRVSALLTMVGGCALVILLVKLAS